MGKLASLGASAAVGLVVGFAIGKLTTTPLVDCSTPASRTIIVRASGALDCPTATIGTQHTITWWAQAGTVLEIDFPAPSPFPYKKCYGNPRCDSYAVKSDLFDPGDPVGTKKEFPYTVKLNGVVQNSNGRIIIQK